MKRIIALFLVLAIAAATLLACAAPDEGEIMGTDDSYKDDDVVMKSENFSYTRAELSIEFNINYREFFYSQDVVDFYNFDVNTSLKDQVYYDDVTWFDYFKDISVEYMKTILLLCEGAKAAGIELSEEDLDYIDEKIRSYVKKASDYDYTEEEYFELSFGPGVDRESLREYYKKGALAARFEKEELDSYNFTEDDLRAYAEEYREGFYTIDYISYTFDEDKDANASAAADALAAISDPAEFDSHIIAYMTDTLMMKSEEITTEDCYYSYKYYDEYSEFSKWAFDGASSGTTYIKKNEVDGQYTVYLLTKAPTLREDLTRDVRTVMIDITAHETTAIAKTYAEELLAEWQAGEATEDSFIKLVEEETDDDAAKSTGGLIEGLAISDIDMEGFDEWLFSEETEQGSAQVFKDTGSYYIVYYKAENKEKWRFDAENALISEKYAQKQESLSEIYALEQFDEIIDSLSA